MEYKWKIVEEPTYEVTKNPHYIRFTGEWDCPISKDRVIIEMGYDDAVAWHNNTDCKQFQIIVKCINARDVKPSDWEVLKGKEGDTIRVVGNKFCSNKCKFKDKKIKIVKTRNIRHLLSKLSSKFYKLKPKNIIAVTGTNGKTSVADIFYQILRINKISAATIGTLGVKYNGRIIKTNLTSPDTITLHKHLNYLKF